MPNPNVVATERGQYGGLIREKGEKFFYTGDKLPSWVKPITKATAAAGPAEDDDQTTDPIVIPADWQSKPAKDRKALAERLSGGKVGNAVDADAIIMATFDDQKPELFADAPAPVVVKGNGVQEALGGNEPDWIAPEQPVQAED